MTRNQHAELLTLNDDDALELFKATLPSTSLMQVQRETAVLAKREFENLNGQAVQGLYSGEACHETQLDAEHVENTKVVSEYQEVIDQLLDDQMSADLVSMKAVPAMADFKPSVFMLDYTGTKLIEQKADHDVIRSCKKVPGVVNTNQTLLCERDS